MARLAEEPRYRFGPLERRGLVLGLRTGQVAWLSGGLLGAVAALRDGSGATGALLGLVLVGLTCAVAFCSIGGATAEEWLPQVGQFAVSRLLGRHRFLSVAHLAGHRFGPDADPRRGTEVAHPPPVLAGVSIRRWRRDTGQVAGALHDRRRQSWAAVLSVRAQSFPLLERTEQRRRVDGWAAALAVLARTGGGTWRVQWVEQSRPDTDDCLGRFLREGLALDPWHPAAVSYRELVAAAGPVTRRHDTFVVLAVSGRSGRSGTSGRRSARDANPGLARTPGVLTVLERELTGLETRLRQADLVVEGVLGPRALAWLLRESFEPRAAGNGPSVGASRPGRSAGPSPGLAQGAEPDQDQPQNAGAQGGTWPLATHTTWSWFRCGEVHHVTYWISEWPRLDVDPDFLAPLLLGTQGARTVAVTMEPVDSRRAARATESARVADAADEELRRRAGFLTSTRRRREAEGVLRRESELADGHAEYRFSAYVTVSAPTHQDLDAACAEVEQAAGQSQLELRRLHGRQDEAFTYTLPLARGLS